MERVTVRAHFHTAHRQLDYPGHCVNVHGHTWRGKIVVETEEFPRDRLDMSLEFGHLKKIMRDLDHKIIVSADDKAFLNPELFDQSGVVLLPGRGPSVENVCLHIWNEVVRYIGETFPGLEKEYRISVEIQETDNNFFEICRSAVV